MTDARTIAARLFFESHLTPSQQPNLREPMIRAEVDKALDHVGYRLVQGEYRNVFGARMQDDVFAQSGIDLASNKGFDNLHLALLVVLWAKLRIPEMTERDRVLPVGGTTLSAAKNLELARDRDNGMRTTTLIAEFKDVLGSESGIRGHLAALEQHHFIERTGDFIRAGPMLELGIDNRLMRETILGFSRLDELRKRAEALPPEKYEDSLENRVIQHLREADGPVPRRRIEERFNLERPRADKLLRALVEKGILRNVPPRHEGLYAIADTGSNGGEPEGS